MYLNIIFPPSGKHFLLPALMIKNYYKALGNRCYICASGDVYRGLKELKEDCLLDANLFDPKQFVGQGSINAVFWYHNTDYAISIFKSVSSKLASFCSDFFISFFPDGFGNAMWGGALRKECEASGLSAAVRSIFAFGFVHETTKKVFFDLEDRIQVLSFSLLLDVCKNYMGLSSYIASIGSVFNVSRPAVLVPYRPWCSSDFHGGIYDFGAELDLSRVYSQLYRIFGATESVFYYRGFDDAHSSRVFNHIDNIDAKVSLDGLFPSWLTLDPILVWLISTMQGSLQLITLDSTTFQIVPFLRAALAERDLPTAPTVEALIGCPESLFDEIFGASDFLHRKLRGKIADFRVRYEGFRRVGLVSELQSIDSSCFRVLI